MGERVSGREGEWEGRGGGEEGKRTEADSHFCLHIKVAANVNLSSQRLVCHLVVNEL